MDAVLTVKHKQSVLAHYALGTVLDCRFWNASVDQQVYQLLTTQGIYAFTWVTNSNLAELTARLQWCELLVGGGIPCPRIVTTRNAELCVAHEQHCIFISEWLLGEPIAAINHAQARQLGKLLGQSHLLGLNDAINLPLTPAITWNHLPIESFLEQLPIAEALLLQEEMGMQHLELSGVLPTGIMHGHLTPSEVWFSGNFILGLLGCYHAHKDALLIDVAAAVHHWCCDTQGEVNPDTMQTLLTAYQVYRRFTPLERRHWTLIRRKVALYHWLVALELSRTSTTMAIFIAVEKHKNILKSLSLIPKI